MKMKNNILVAITALFLSSVIFLTAAETKEGEGEGEGKEATLIFSKKGAVLLEEDGKEPLAEKFKFEHCEWVFTEEGMLGTRDKSHNATISATHSFNNVILQFDIKFIDSGAMKFVSWKRRSGHAFDVHVDQMAQSLVLLKGDLDGKEGPDKKARLAEKKGVSILINKWYTVTIEQKGDRAALHFDGHTLEVKHEGLLKERWKFFINVGGKKKNEKTLIRNIKLWKAE